MTPSRLVILGYHRIGPPDPGGWETWFFVPEATFDAHLTLIREHGWTPIDLDALVAGLADPASLPERPLLITFDDGYRCAHDVALPVLRRHDTPGVLFVPTEHVGGPNAFDPWEPAGRICTWDELRALEAGGVAVESHAATHRGFSDLTLDERLEELRASKEALDRELATPTRFWAYPFGDTGPDQAALEEGAAALGYAGACLYPGGDVALPVENPFRLARIAMGPDTDLAAVLAGEA